jgi:hypothetical protein
MINTGSLYSDHEISHSQGLRDIYALQDQNFTLYFRSLSFVYMALFLCCVKVYTVLRHKLQSNHDFP